MRRIAPEPDDTESQSCVQNVVRKGTATVGELDVRVARQVAFEHRNVTPVFFGFSWCFITGYHFVNAAFLLLLGAVHVYISIPTIYANIWLIRIDERLLFMSGLSLLIVAASHLIALGQNIVQSILQRRLTFGRDDACQGQKDLSKKSGSIIKIVCLPVEWMKRLIGERGLFGVYGEYFYVGFYIRQAVEIAMQTYQAYQFSLSISRDWINGLVMAVITTNCTFVPVVNYWLRQYPGRRCAVLLTIDLLLDFLVLVFIPLVSMIPYAFQFDWAAGRYDPTYTYDDVWITTIIAEVRQGMISSELDYVSTMFPHIAGLLTLDTIKGFLQRATTNDISKTARNDVKSGSTKRDKTTQAKGAMQTHVPTTLFYSFCFGWLVFTLSSHGKSQLRRFRSNSEICLSRGNAWFATGDTCFVVEVNCHRIGIQGTDSEITAVLEPLEESAVSRLILSHCPTLHVPRIVATFRSISSVEIFNSTLVDWPRTAAMSDTTNPHLSQLHFLATNFSVFPSALLQSKLPHHLGMIVFRSNLTELPDSVGTVWDSHEWSYFQIEYTKLRALPKSFARVRSARISFVNNELEKFEHDAFGSSTILTSLRLSGNNIRALPDVYGSIGVLYQMLAENTRITTVPVWFESWWKGRQDAGKPVFVSFRGSPLCEVAVYTVVCGNLPLVESGDFRFDLILNHRKL